MRFLIGVSRIVVLDDMNDAAPREPELAQQSLHHNIVCMGVDTHVRMLRDPPFYTECADSLNGAISRMKDGVVLVNCARGELMDVNALIEGIESQKIGALGIDTIEEEEGIVHRDLRTDIFSDRNLAYIKQFKNVTYTYHMAFYTDAAVKNMAECGIRGLLQMVSGESCPTQLC